MLPSGHAGEVSLFYSQHGRPESLCMYRRRTQNQITNRLRCRRHITEIAASQPKNGKSPAKPRQNSRWEAGESRLSFRLNPVSLLRWSVTQAETLTEHFPPSLGAKYRRLCKTCQEKLTLRPQNLRLEVSKASISSGACANAHNQRRGHRVYTNDTQERDMRRCSVEKSKIETART